MRDARHEDGEILSNPSELELARPGAWEVLSNVHQDTWYPASIFDPSTGLRVCRLIAPEPETAEELDYRTNETLLEVVAEALAASYGSTTFSTAANLILELEKRDVLIGRGERILT